MEQVTTTDFTTKSSQVVTALKKGKSVQLVHDDEVVGTIQPVIHTSKPINGKEFEKFLTAIRPKKLIPRNKRDEIYRKRLEAKYGKRVS